MLKATKGSKADKIEIATALWTGGAELSTEERSL
jgi:hypothetical protein